MVKQELKAVMARYGDTQADLAAYLGRSERAISDKITGKADFWRSEIEKIAIRYNLTLADIQRIFFTQIVA